MRSGIAASAAVRAGYVIREIFAGGVARRGIDAHMVRTPGLFGACRAVMARSVAATEARAGGASPITGPGG